MNGYAPTATWLPLLGAGFLAAMSLYCFRWRATPAALPLGIQALFGVLYLLCLAFESAAIVPAAKIAWFKFGNVWLLPALTAGTCFILEYVYPGRWLTRRNLALFAIAPVLHALVVLTGGVPWAWRSLAVGPHDSVATVLGPESVVAVAYATGLILLGVAALLWLFFRSPAHHAPVMLMLIGVVAGRAPFLLDYTGEISIPPAALLAVLLTWGTYAVALFGFRILDPVPAARAAAFQQTRDGMVVLDPDYRVVSVNPAAADMLSCSQASARGKPLAEVLPAACDHVAPTRGASMPPFEVSLASGAGLLHYAVHLIPLHDFREQFVGHLLLLNDITEQKRAQAELLEQRAASAMLKERDRLARELHDQLGQMLAFVKLQAQAARDQLACGREETADAYLAGLMGAAQEAHTDLREYILGARARPGEQLDLLAELREFLRQFRESSGLSAELIECPGFSTAALDPVVQAHLLRIVQEALTNARKHARAQHVRVFVERADGRAQVTIQDDGAGFDPDTETPASAPHAAGPRTAGGLHFGLALMRERALEMGGSLAIVSAHGLGTRVVVDAPLREAAPAATGEMLR